MRDKLRRAFVLNGETLHVETPCGGIKIVVDSDGAITTSEYIPYKGVAVSGPSEVAMVGADLEKEWLEQWSQNRQPWHLYDLLRRLEDV